MESVRQDRTQFFHPTNDKVRAIRSWELLTQRALDYKYRAYLNDRTIPGLIHCCRAWLTMEDVDHCQNGDIILIEDRFAIEVIGTHRTEPRKPTYRGDFVHVPIGCLWEFLCWYDRVFTIHF